MIRSTVLVVLVLAFGVARPADADTGLRLAPGLSFTDDSSSDFPIQGADASDAQIGAGRATVIFFGASNCWNTNREAERLVALYPRFRDRVRFLVVDVAHPTPAQRALLKSHYRGAIPTLAIFDPQGKVTYAQAGETAGQRGDTNPLAQLIHRALGE